MAKSSIRFRLIAWYMSISFIIILIFSTLIYTIFNRKLYGNIDTFLNEEAESINNYIATNGMNNIDRYIEILMKEKTLA